MTFWYLVKVVKSRILIILGLVVLTPAVIYVAAPKPKIVFPATALVSPTAQVMRAGVSTSNPTDRTVAELPDRNVILSNLIILAQGGDVYERAREFLELPVDEQEKLAPGFSRYKSIRRIDIEPGKPLSMGDWREVLEVTPVQNLSLGEKGTTTDVIRITVNLTDSSISPYLANAVAHAFAEAYQEKSREDIRRYIKFLESSRESSRKRLHALQQSIASYKNTHRVLAVDAETVNAITTLARLESEVGQEQASTRSAFAAVADINTQLAREPSVLREPMPADMSPEVMKIKSELINAELELRNVALRYKKGHSNYDAAQSKVAALKEVMLREGANYAPPSVNKIHHDLLGKRSEAEYNLATSRARLASITASLAEAQTKADNLAKAEPGLVELMREYGQLENSYNMVSEKLAQSEVAEEEFSKTGSIQILDGARGSDKEQILGPTQKMLMLYGLVLALVVGIAGSVWFESIDNRMRNSADVEKWLELPVIGLTPQLIGRNGDLSKLTHMYPLSAMAESYRILRTNVLFALRDTPFKTLMVATGRPGEGATTTICNLAIALAQIGKRIILIDADMRRPSLHTFFNVSNETGLSNVLEGSCKLTDAFRKTDVENLIVIPSGPIPSNPSELLGSDRMREIVDMLQAHCDLVLFDTPSTIVFSDGPMLASWIDAVLMVVSANQIPRGSEVATRDLLRRANANIIGAVVNRMPQERVDSCYYYSRYYSDSASGESSSKALESDGLSGPKAIPAGMGESEDENKPFPD